MTIDEMLRDAASSLLIEVRSDVDSVSALDRTRREAPGQRRRTLAAAAAAVLLVVVTVAALVMAAGEGGDDVITDTTAPSTTTEPLRSWGVPMTVTPREGLVDGDQVAIVAPDVVGGADHRLELCPASVLDGGSPGTGSCVPLEGDVTSYPAAVAEDPTSVVDVRRSAVIRRMIIAEGRDPIDCATEGTRCAVGLSRFVAESTAGAGERTGRIELIAAVEVAFALQDPLPPPTVSVEPTDGLRHGDTVTVTGEGFGGSVQRAEVCVADDGEGGCWSSTLGDGFDGPVLDDGAFTSTTSVWRVLAGPAGWIDCAAVGCVLVVRDDDGRTSAPVPLGFAPGPMPQPPTVTATPATGLRPGDPVTVTVVGLRPGEQVSIMACSSLSPGEIEDTPDGVPHDDCSAATSIGEVVAAADGTARVTIPAIDPAEYGVDCTETGRCSVGLSGSPFGDDPLLFDAPSAPIAYAP